MFRLHVSAGRCLPLRAGILTYPSERGSLGHEYIQVWKIVGSRIYSGKFLLVMHGNNISQTKKKVNTPSIRKLYTSLDL